MTGAQVAEYDSARCFIYSLQRVVNESMKVQAEVLDMTKTSSKLFQPFRFSTKKNPCKPNGV